MKLIHTYFLFLTATTLSAQSIDKTVVASAGSTMSVSELTIGYTIGESIVGFTANENAIDQGFWAGSLQVVAITAEKQLDGIVVYPNPVMRELSIFTNNNEINAIDLFGLDGRRVLKQTVETSPLEHKIDLGSLSKGVYVLRLFIKDESEAKLFKIIKK